MKPAILLLTLTALMSLHAADKVARASARAEPVESRQAARQVLAVRASQPIPNELIDFPQYLRIARDVEPVREKHRLTEEQFAAMAAEPGTVVLDARSADKFRMRHIKGAVNLPFTDFTAEALAKAIPTKTTRLLIYCNNNFRGAPVSLAAKRAEASLNISTYVALATYGYTNIYELGPLLDVKTTKLLFEGTELSETR
jgi:phage shock protein E